MKPIEVDTLEECAELGVLDPGRVTEKDGHIQDVFNALGVVREGNGFVDEGDIVIVCRCSDGTTNLSALNPYLGIGARIWAVNLHE